MGGSAMRSSRLGATQAGVGTNDHRVRSQARVELSALRLSLVLIFMNFAWVRCYDTFMVDMQQILVHI